MWTDKRVLVTGGASFIGSHLVDALVKRGAVVRVVDNLSSGRLRNIESHLRRSKFEFVHADLRRPEVAEDAVTGADVVFHLAANHGGRGYIDTHQVACADNLLLDGIVFQACRRARVGKIVFASSGCVYPKYLQTDSEQPLYLTEEMVKPPHDADNMYGWAKLMGEMTLRAYFEELGIKSASCRFFTVYGERGTEDHAVIAMIARAFVEQNPFIVWGTGNQVRNWTYVGDIIEGTIRAAERIDDASAVNLGTTERIHVLDAVEQVLEYTNHSARIQLQPDMPMGPINRVADNSLAKRLLGWEPRVAFWDGLRRTIDWYYSTHDRVRVRSTLDRLLTEREPDPPSSQVEGHGMWLSNA